MAGLPKVDSYTVIQKPQYRGLEELEDSQKIRTDEKISAITPILQNQQAPVNMQNSNSAQKDGYCLSSREVRQLSKECCISLAAATGASVALTLLAYLLNKYGA